MGYCVIGKTTVDREVYKWHTSAKNQHSSIPTFHHSGTRQKSKPQKSLYIQYVVEFPRRLIIRLGISTTYWSYRYLLVLLQIRSGNNGMLEYWNDVKEKKTKILLNPTFHYSNIPLFPGPDLANRLCPCTYEVRARAGQLWAKRTKSIIIILFGHCQEASL